MLMPATFMDCPGTQFNLEFHNMKVNPWKVLSALFFTSVLEIEPCFEAGPRGKKGTSEGGPLGTVGTLFFQGPVALGSSSSLQNAGRRASHSCSFCC